MASKRNTNDYLAVRFLRDHEVNPALNLLYVKDQDTFYLYEENVWIPYSDKDFRDLVYGFITALKFHPTEPLKKSQNITMASVYDVVEQIKTITKQKTLNLTSTHIVYNNDIALDLTSSPFTPTGPKRSHYSIYKAHSDYNPTFPAPPPVKFLAFLDEVLVLSGSRLPDHDLIDYMQEIFGYCLLDTIAAQQAFFFYGSGANGKSVLLQILQAMFPPEVISSNTLQSLTNNRFSLSNLRSKRLNIANEEESKHIRSDLFKNLISGEQVTAERKFQSEFEFSPRLKLIFATNKIPKLDGVESAIKRRLKIIPFHASISYEAQDPFLAKTIIETELPNIINWSLTGAERLVKRNFKFNEPEALHVTFKEFETGQSSVMEFSYENLQVTGNHEDILQRSVLYDAYKLWCEHNGRKPFGRNSFLSEIKQRFQDEKVSIPDGPSHIASMNKKLRVVHGMQRTTDTSAWLHTTANPLFISQTDIENNEPAPPNESMPF